MLGGPTMNLIIYLLLTVFLLLTMLFFGIIRPYKGLDVLLDAMRRAGVSRARRGG